ncbi:suppressor of lurcher protein 1-like [Oratosquilla oratoria]|uniref:suppressor of lurcher protein 1-like n=1 Tax=Oratosquilla oratoria TaxID=337810 RepID=UPI003F768FFD
MRRTLLFKHQPHVLYLRHTSLYLLLLPPLVLLFLLVVVVSRVEGKTVGTNEVYTCDQIFDSTDRLSGIITSPSYPLPYPPHVQCRLSLRGKGRQRVLITFSNFLLHHPLNESSSNLSCEGVDSLTAYNGPRALDKITSFCGAAIPKRIMSSGPHLTLLFRSYTSGPHAKGFRIKYIFVRDFGLSGGRQVEGEPCTFEYNSTVASSGEFTSPNPSGYYPRNTVCHFVFRGQKDERVRIDFKYFDVEGVAPCTHESDSDYVEFSSFPSADRKQPRRCGRFRPKIVESDSSYFRVTFRSNDKFDGTGFMATYQFIPNGRNPHAIKRVTSISRAAHLSGQAACCYVYLLGCVFQYFCKSFSIL